MAGAVVAAVLLAGGVAYAGRTPAGRGFRTATASVRSVDQVLTSVGTIEPVSQASVAFPVSGTVAAVDVAVGDTVAVGHRLATLDVADLQATVRSRQAELDQAELLLEKALAGEDVSGLGGTGGSGGTTGGSGSAPTGISLSSSDSSSSSTSGTLRAVALTQTTTAQPTDQSTDQTGGSQTIGSGPTATSTPTNGTDTDTGGDTPTVTGTDAELRAAQQRVLDAQRAADEALARAETALQTAVDACAASAAGDGGTAGCEAALQAVLEEQQAVALAQQEVVDASDAYTALLDERAADLDSGSTPGGTTPEGTTPDSDSGTNGSGTTGSGTNGSGTNGSGTTGSTTSSTPSAADLVAYQKAVDAAAARLAVAEQAVAQATIVSPIGGTVVSVGLAAGDEVTGGSSTATVVVVGEGGFEVTTSVAVTDLPDVEVGQAATVVPDGGTGPVTGEVVRIGVASTTSGTTTYPVVIGLTGDTSTLGNGATASVTIVTDQAEDALAVPTSALTAGAGTDGTRYTVRVVVNGQAEERTVEIGALGATWTAVTSGLEEGDEVVLADLDEPLPGSATEATSSGSDQGGQVVRQGGPPEGFTGGPPSGFPGGN